MSGRISRRLLLATGNSGKLNEIREILSDLPFELLALEAFGNVDTANEQGSSYEENAVIKARACAKKTGLWSLADDSGLEVTALRGAPGVFSARYAGEHASDTDRIVFLLKQLASVANEDRTARFVCVTAIVDSEAGIINLAQGICEGIITNTPRGTNGFGYDPVFVPNGYDATFAELPSHIKNVISHRGRALRATRDFLVRLARS